MLDRCIRSATERVASSRGVSLPPSALLALIATAGVCLTGCQVVEGIFKAGFWVGAIVVIAVVALVIFIAVKALS